MATAAHRPPADVLRRAEGALLGLALGDAWGRTLEFVRFPRVRTEPVFVGTGSFRWTDDTHMALYLGKAILDLPAGPLNPDRFGHAVGRRFVEWLGDPLTPSTAPGNTCLRGARAYQETGSWQDSGDPRSDGCGAVTRIAPVGIVWADDDLVEAARVSAVVTHAHPNATEAAIAGAWMVRRAIDSGAFDEETALTAARLLRDQWGQGGMVAESLEAAVAVARRLRADPSATWLPEAEIPAGDGGWRSPSALGLAVAAALAWADDFAVAVERAARIDGDSDSVAALAGVLLGAAGGPEVLPIRWLDVLPARDEIAELSRALVERWAAGGAVDPHPSVLPGAPGDLPRTSTSHPLDVSWLDLGLPGRVGLSQAPGMKAPSAFGTPWDRDLEQDLDRLVSVHRASALLCLLPDDELARLGIPDLLAEAEARSVVGLRLPIADGGVPPAAAALNAVDVVLAFARAGHDVVVHCRAGLGRSGVLAACCLVRQGVAPDQAIEQVRRWRGRAAVETEEQERFVHAFALALASRPSPS